MDRPTVRAGAIRLVLVADALGLLPPGTPIERLDTGLIRDIARRALAEGVAQEAALAILEDTRRTTSEARWQALIADLEHALAGSPLPERELGPLLRTYGHEALGGLLRISPASLRRYAVGQRAVPDLVAARAHFLALVTADLAGSYNDIGLRRWWERPRTALDGKTPRDALGEAWDPETPGPQVIAALARPLSGSGGAT